MRKEVLVEVQLLGELADGRWVVDRFESHLQVHAGLDQKPELLAEALSRITVPEEQLWRNEGIPFVVSFAEVIGVSEAVRRRPDDEQAWAVPLGRKTYRNYALNRQPEDCQTVALVLRWVGRLGTFELITAYIGLVAELYRADEIADPLERRRQYWRDYVLVYPGDEWVIKGSLTHTRPNNWEYGQQDSYLT